MLRSSATFRFNGSSSLLARSRTLAFVLCSASTGTRRLALWTVSTLPPTPIRSRYRSTHQPRCRVRYSRLSKLVAKPVPVERWDVKKEVFYRALPDLLARLPKPDTVKREELDRMMEERERFKSVSVQLEEECDTLKRHIRDLEAAKDADAVATIRKEYSSEWEQYETLRSSCRAALKELPRVIREALFYWVRGDAFEPDFKEWGDDVEKALENKLLPTRRLLGR